jgi:hypothetical protein
VAGFLEKTPVLKSLVSRAVRWIFTSGRAGLKKELADGIIARGRSFVTHSLARTLLKDVLRDALLRKAPQDVLRDAFACANAPQDEGRSSLHPEEPPEAASRRIIAATKKIRRIFQPNIRILGPHPA